MADFATFLLVFGILGASIGYGSYAFAKAVIRLAQQSDGEPQ